MPYKAYRLGPVQALQNSYRLGQALPQAGLPGPFGTLYLDIWKNWDSVDSMVLELLAIWRERNVAKSGSDWFCKYGNWYSSRDRLSLDIRSVSGDGWFSTHWDELLQSSYLRVILAAGNHLVR